MRGTTRITGSARRRSKNHGVVDRQTGSEGQSAENGAGQLPGQRQHVGSLPHRGRQRRLYGQHLQGRQHLFRRYVSHAVLRRQTNPTDQNSEIIDRVIARTHLVWVTARREMRARLFISLTPGGDRRQLVTVVQNIRYWTMN